jgi:hypothetical protein
MSISSVTSEALQLKLRQLLPSQQGFGTDLSASDTIIPIIDLTAAAEGSDVPENLQTALAFGSQTSFAAQASTVTIVNTAGFYRIIAGLTIKGDSSDVSIIFNLNDGVTDKEIYGYKLDGASSNPFAISTNVEFNVFLRSGDNLNVVSSANKAIARGSVRQIADANGVLVNPVGFNPQ